MPDGSRTSTFADLAALADLSASVHEPRALYAAVDALVRIVIGHRLFTILRVHEAGLVPPAPPSATRYQPTA